MVQRVASNEFDLNGARPADGPKAEAEFDHRMANSLQFLATMLRTESRRMTSVEDARQALRRAGDRLGNIAQLHRVLSGGAAGARVDLGDYLRKIAAEASESMGAHVHVLCDPIEVPGAVAARVGIILSELAINAVKHGGQAEGRPVAVTVSGSLDAAGQLRLRISDNGVGLGEGFDLAAPSGLGMTIVTKSVAELGGRIEAQVPSSAGAGAEFEITVPAGWTGGAAA